MTVNDSPAQSLGSDGREILLGGLRAVTDPPHALLPLGPFDFVILAPDTDDKTAKRVAAKAGAAASVAAALIGANRGVRVDTGGAVIPRDGESIDAVIAAARRDATSVAGAARSDEPYIR